ncbi:MAG: hypothetical protein HY718_10625 [Planctomycetes bacterium]|nr:hypothetical protein [Planctomycetota bacterium]
MSHDIVELFGHPTSHEAGVDWKAAIRTQRCPYLGRTCIKVRKSQPRISIGTCTVLHGAARQPVMICPFRLLEGRQIFADCLHLLTLHEPGNELHVIPEMTLPGGSVDYFLVSATKGKPVDFVGIELQTLDTTGTVWPARPRFLKSVGAPTDARAAKSPKPYGINWKMTAKTILVQLHHKIQTFEHISKHLVLIVQDRLLEYMGREFTLDHLSDPKLGHAMHFHAYSLDQHGTSHRLQLAERRSTDAAGISMALGLQEQANVELSVILADIEAKLSARTRWTPA